MGNAVKVMFAAIVGYILGRRKKFKLAVALGLFLGAKKLKIKPQDLVNGLRKEVAELPVVGELTEQTREQLLTGAREAVNKIVAKWAASMADALTERTANLTEAATGTVGTTTEAATDTVSGAAGTDEEAEAEEEPEPEEAEEEPEPEEAEEEPEPEPEPPAPKRRSRAKSTTSGSRSGTRKATPRKRASAKKQEQDDERE